MTRKGQVPVVVVALPFAYREGVDRYNGIMRYLRERDLDWELRIVRETLSVEPFRQSLRGRISGVICGTAGRFADGQRSSCLVSVCLDVCQRRRIPFVGLDWPKEATGRRRPPCGSFLNIDSEEIGSFAAEVLLKADNYASYGFVGMYSDVAWSRDRGAFFARGLRKAGRHCIRIFKGDVLDDAAALPAWLKAMRKPAAIFASNDFAADAVLRTCMQNGLRVQDDIAVLGVDDDPVFCVHTRPTLSSIHPDFEEMGYLAARELDRLMAGRSKGRKLTVRGTLTVTSRMSTAPCSSAGVLVRRIDEIIEARACQNLSSNAIADELKISRRLLDLRYRQQKGMSIREAIVRARVRRAKYLLAYSGHMIETISRLCGYRTASYLGKVFLAHEGVSMGGYRDRIKRQAKLRSTKKEVWHVKH